MKEFIISKLHEITSLPEQRIQELIEVPKDTQLGDYSFPCFSLASSLKKSPTQIAQELAKQFPSSEHFEKIGTVGPYLNFFVNRVLLTEATLKTIFKQNEKYGSNTTGKGKNFVIDMSSPNIAKPFGIGHLRSTVIGNSIANIARFSGYKVTRINYLGDWGTPFGKTIAAYKEFGDARKLKENPINHLYELYVKASKDPSFEDKGKEWFKKLEDGDAETVKLWKQFRNESLKEFDKIYKLLGVSFEVISGESEYEELMPAIIKELEEKKLLEENQGAFIVNLEKYSLGVCLIKKSDGATLYATRDITAAIHRKKKYKFDTMVYEVGAEQKLHFRQFFKVLELMGYVWAKDCVHVAHGFYLDEDGKKFATRRGKSVFMAEILDETIELAKKELLQREKLKEKELLQRALAITRAAIIYGDLKNYREQNTLFDIDKFLSFEGDTGPYLLYTYARAKSILAKSKFVSKKKMVVPTTLGEKEKRLVTMFAQLPEVVKSAHQASAPHLIANYSYHLAQTFNEFYHAERIIGSEQEQFRLALVSAFSIVIKNALALLGIPVIEKM